MKAVGYVLLTVMAMLLTVALAREISRATNNVMSRTMRTLETK